MRIVPLFALALVAAVSQAQEPRPVPAGAKTTSHEAAGVKPVVSQDKVPFMFVQTAEGGSFEARPGGSGFKLTLRGVAPQALYFSDRPERIAGGVPNGTFLKGLGFGKANPPNAAVVLSEPKSDKSDVVIVTLENPVYDAAARTLVYQAKPLEKTDGTGLAFWKDRRDGALPGSFSSVSVFIDDCPDGRVHCYGAYDSGGRTKCRTDCGTLDHKVGYCWSYLTMSCRPCHDHVDECKADGAPCSSSGNVDPMCRPRTCSTTPDCM
jgi:hypothetical protein